MTPANHQVLRTGGSRCRRGAFGAPRRLPPVAHLGRWAKPVRVLTTMRCLLLVTVLATGTRASGQTCFTLRNFTGHGAERVDAPVLDPSGVPLRGTNYMAELWGSATPDRLTPLRDVWTSQRVFARFGGTNGYFTAGNLMRVEGINEWASWAWLQVRVWDSSLGSAYEQVAERGLGGFGVSPLFYAQGSPGPLCDPPCLPAPLIGLHSFRLARVDGVLMRGIRREGDQVRMEWFPGFPRYQVQSCSGLGGGWQDDGAPTALTVGTNTASESSRFFRVVGLPY